MTQRHFLTERGPRGVVRITFNRPEVHNAINDEVIAELGGIVAEVEADADVRVVVLAAKGKSFCAGGDLKWMLKTAEYSRAENIADARTLSEVLHALNGLAKPTLALVQGPAYGGGVGIVACCDIVIAAERARFAFTEVKLGLIPATISPYAVRKISAGAARRYFLTAEAFDAHEAARLGLVHKVVPDAELEEAGAAMLAQLALGGPGAQAASKELIARVAHGPVDRDMMDYTARGIADARASDEGKEGARAFFEKRKPRWAAD